MPNSLLIKEMSIQGKLDLLIVDIPWLKLRSGFSGETILTSNYKVFTCRYLSLLKYCNNKLLIIFTFMFIHFYRVPAQKRCGLVWNRVDLSNWTSVKDKKSGWEGSKECWIESWPIYLTKICLLICLRFFFCYSSINYLYL